MTQRHQHKRRTFPCPQDLWETFTAVHGKGNVSARIRDLMARDMVGHSEAPPGGTVPGAHSTEQQSSTSPRKG